MSLSSTNPPFGSSANDNGVWQHIINEIPPHDTLMLLCLGTSKLLPNIRPATQTIGVDHSSYVLELWKQKKQDRSLEWANENAIDYLLNYPWKKEEQYVIFIDPPSLENESDFDHTDLVETLPLFKKGYRNLYFVVYHPKHPTYDQALSDWRTVSFGQRMGKHHLYISGTLPKGMLHDYRYVGKDWRDRDELKKAVNRWEKTFTKMAAEEREVLLSLLYSYEWPEKRDTGYSCGVGMINHFHNYQTTSRLAILWNLQQRLQAKGLFPEDIAEYIDFSS